jgi:DNA-binding CsgD family transcriptional regulator
LNDEERHLNGGPSSPQVFNAVDRLSRLQTELVTEALKRAVDDVNAAMAHRLGEPLTALLLYLHEIKQVTMRSDVTDSASVLLRETIEMALREAERVCDIIERAARFEEMRTDAEAGVTRGREAINMWAWTSRARADGPGSPVEPRVNRQSLTPREQEVLALVIAGCSNKEGGYRLGISTRTFEAHRAHLMGKLGAKNAADLIRKSSSRDQ